MRTRELFADDLARVDAMLGELVGQTRALLAARAGPQQAAQACELLFGRLVQLVSSLLEPAQRFAWLELQSGELRARLELRLLEHLREAGLMLAAAIERPLERAAWQEANVYAAITAVAKGAALAELPADPQDYVAPLSQSEAAGSMQSQPASQLRLHSALLRELTATGEYAHAHAHADRLARPRPPLTTKRARPPAGLTRLLVLDVRRDQSYASGELVASSDQPTRVFGKCLSRVIYHWPLCH